jgi:hypothetical protein
MVISFQSVKIFVDIRGCVGVFRQTNAREGKTTGLAIHNNLAVRSKRS